MGALKTPENQQQQTKKPEFWEVKIQRFFLYFQGNL